MITIKRQLKLSGLFLLLLLAGAAQAGQRVVLIADLNGRYGSTSYSPRVTAAMEVITGLQPELVISAGDMVAGQQQPRLDADWLDRMWAGFNSAVTEPLQRAGIPLAVTVGNHDGSAFPGFELEQERFQAQWQQRVPELSFLPGSEWPWRYGARIGGLLLLAFDGTMPGAVSAGERGFVEGMLQRYSGDAEATIVVSHLPMWPLASGREHETLNDAAFLELLHRHGVDVYASGHHHAYFAGLDEAGMLHLAVGALGGNARAYSGRAARPAAQLCGIGIWRWTGGGTGPGIARFYPARAGGRFARRAYGPAGHAAAAGCRCALAPLN